MKFILPALLFFAGCIATLSAQTSDQPQAAIPGPDQDYLITISTSLGDMKLVLYDATPLHKANFVKLANEHYYDHSTFHRIINNFMIQGGDPESKPGGNEALIGNGGPGYTVPAEFVAGLKHTKGKLCAARQGDHVNPQRASSGSQFYIVQNPYGTPHLDGQYTIFGEVVKGLDIVDAIALRPNERIEMIVTAEIVDKATLKTTYNYSAKK